MVDDDHRLFVDRGEEIGLEYLARAAIGHHGSFAHDQDSARMHRSGVEVVEHGNDGPVFGEHGGEGHDSLLVCDVEGGDGFVEEDDRGGLGYDPSEGHPGLFTS